MKLIQLLPNTLLTNEKGENKHFHDIIKDKTIILNMFYSNCNVKCIPLGKLMKKVNLLINKYICKEDIHFISITLDPQNDTIEDLNNFKNKVWDNKCINWNFYTGNPAELNVLRRKLGMYSPEPEIDAIKSNHSGSFMIFNTKTGFTKHTTPFDNPLDISRKTIQLLTRNFYTHSYDLKDIDYECLTDDELFENIHSMNSVFTTPFLPQNIREKFDKYAELQRGFQYKPPIGSSCNSCKKK